MLFLIQIVMVVAGITLMSLNISIFWIIFGGALTIMGVFLSVLVSGLRKIIK